MASSSSSSSSLVPQTKHDVFVSFRGPDTRRGFVSHLYEALCQKKIAVFVDDKLERGDEISTALLEAIERSRISLIVFSKDYASSKWCLNELVKIMECCEKNRQVVIPIFYEIDPSNVRHLSGSYEAAFREYGKVFKDDMYKVHNWSNALKRAADISGFDFSHFRTEAELVNQIIELVLKRLKYILRGSKTPKVLVGIHEKVASLESLIVYESETVRIIGIWGMGGIGKTTIAQELYDRLHFNYEASGFLLNVCEMLEKHGVTFLQNELFRVLLDEKIQSICFPIMGNEYIMEKLRRTRVLLVLDDVNDLGKWKQLFGWCHWFGQGSRVIVTSRDKHLLTNIVDDTYEVKALNFEDSLQLFRLNAFKENDPKLEWTDLTKRAVNYTGGIPLALEILGSSLYGKQKELWESQLRKLEKVPLPGIQNVLRLSYDGLDPEEKEIFLYLACFFQMLSFDWLLYNRITTLLNDCGYSTHLGLTNLQDKALVTIHDHVRGKPCVLHDLIRDMGREIVREKSKDHPGEYRHLWDPDDCYQVFENVTGTGAIQSIILDLRGCKGKVLRLSSKAFNGMFNLKFLVFDTYIYDWFISVEDEANSFQPTKLAPKGLESMPNSLRILHWTGCPLKSLPSTFCAKNLIEIDLSHSLFLERLWNGVQNLAKLKRIKLKNCEQLMELPDFSEAVNLEEIDARGCSSLKEFSMMLSKRRGSSSLPHNFLQVSGLSYLREFTLDFFTPCCSLGCLTILNLSGTNIESLPASIKHLSDLRELCLSNCKRLRFLPPLPSSVQILDASNCIFLEEVSIATNVLSWSSDARFSFKNCVRLNQQVVNTIMSDAHVMMKLCAYNLYQVEDISVEVCLPGGEVPEDMYPYETAYQTFQVSSPSNLVGFIFCFVVFRKGIADDMFLKCYLKRRRNGQLAEFESISFAHVLWSFSTTRADPEHILLMQDAGFSRRIIDKIKETNADAWCTGDLKLLFEIYSGLSDDIKEWGIWPLYTSDFFTSSEKLPLLLVANTKRGRDVTDELLDIESLPPPKKLKIQSKKGQPATHCLIVSFLKHLWRLVCSLLMLRFLIKKYKQMISWWSKEKEE